MKFSKGLPAFAITVLLVALSGACATRTRFGDIIPAHKNSDFREGEVVRIDLIPGKKPSAVSAAGVPPVLATAAISLALEFVKGEIEKEAKRYEAQFGKRILLRTTDLEGGNYLVLTRWIASTKTGQPTGEAILDILRRGIPDLDLPVDLTTLQLKYSAMAAFHARRLTDSKNATDAAQKVKIVSEIQNLREQVNALSNIVEVVKPSAGKELAFAFVSRIESQNVEGVYRLSPVLLWSSKSKAKVVDFNLRNSWKFWSWIGGALFHTDSQVAYSIQTTVRTLVKGKEGDVLPISVDPSHPALVEHLHDLDTPTPHNLQENSGIWFGVPILTAGSGGQAPQRAEGYLTLEFLVTERDASNIQKLLLKGAERIGENKEGIIQKIIGN